MSGIRLTDMEEVALDVRQAVGEPTCLYAEVTWLDSKSGLGGDSPLVRLTYEQAEALSEYLLTWLTKQPAPKLPKLPSIENYEQ